jgi:hypothetical protein
MSCTVALMHCKHSMLQVCMAAPPTPPPPRQTRPPARSPRTCPAPPQIPSTDNTYQAALSGASAEHTRFTFSDTLTDEQLGTMCPVIKAITDPFMNDPSVKRLWPLWRSGPDGEEMVKNLVKNLSPELNDIFQSYSDPKKEMLLRVPSESRQAYAYASLQRTITWRVPLLSGEQPVLVNQSCSWIMCMPRALAAMAICDMFKGINDTSPASFKNSHGRGAVVWGAYFDTTIRSKGGRFVVGGTGRPGRPLHLAMSRRSCACMHAAPVLPSCLPSSLLPVSSRQSPSNWTAACCPPQPTGTPPPPGSLVPPSLALPHSSAC